MKFSSVILLFGTVLAASLLIVKGCRSTIMASSALSTPDITIAEAVGECLKSSLAGIVQSPSVVIDYVMHDSNWYKNTKDNACVDSMNTPECWISSLMFLLDRRSPVYHAAAKCICKLSGTCEPILGGSGDSMTATAFPEERYKPPEKRRVSLTKMPFATCIAQETGLVRPDYTSSGNVLDSSITNFLYDHYTYCRSNLTLKFSFAQRVTFQILYMDSVCPRHVSNEHWRENILDIYEDATRRDSQIWEAIGACRRKIYSNVDPCTAITCQTNSRCVQSNGSAVCECNEGYGPATNGSCQAIEVDPCSEKNCPPLERCFAYRRRSYCLCQAGYMRGKTGQCEHPCIPNPCQNGGMCTRPHRTEQVKCTCVPPYTGNNCEIDVFTDPCAKNPCQNGGVCESTMTKYQCRCRRGFSGKKCQHRPRCPGVMVYTECASRCRDSCSVKHDVCTEDCDPDVICVCPPGMVKRRPGSNRCIRKEDCPEKRERRIVCRAWGDPHYFTFDNSGRHDFMGKCSYVLSETKSIAMTDDRWFRVVSENEVRYNNTDVSYVKEATIYLNGGLVTIVLLKDGTVMVNGATITEANSPLFEITRSGGKVILSTIYDVSISFNGDALHIKVPKSYKSMVKGLCGNYNENADDDLIMDNGVMARDYNEFAVSHQFGDCDKPLPPPVTCSEDDRIKWSGPDFCGMFHTLRGSFSDCSILIDSNVYFEACLFDICATGGNMDALEQNLEQYVADCKDNGIDICDWRMRSGRKEFSCPSHSTYSGCASTCHNTCVNPNAAVDCQDNSTEESCVCDEGRVRDGTRCVLSSECGCVRDYLYFSIGQFFDSENATCVCEGPNSFKCACKLGYELVGDQCRKIVDPCTSSPCMNGGMCSSSGTQYSCTCVSAFSGSNCEIIPDPCFSNPCLNGGECVSNNNTGSDIRYICKCTEGYIGMHCEREFINPCDTNPCENGGVCLVQVNTYKCECPEGYRGDNCQRPPRCPGNKVYTGCASRCIDSCDKQHDNCTADCNPDNNCACPTGLVEKKPGRKRCIPLEKCPQQSGTRAVCRAWGDPHYLLFDTKVSYMFQGACKYVMAETKGIQMDDSRWFRVVAENERRYNETDVSWLKEVTVYLDGGATKITLGKKGVILVNGNEVLEGDSETLEISRRGKSVSITTEYGVTVSFNGNGMRIIISQDYKKQIMGLCGNFNGNPGDDLTMENGTMASHYTEFALSHQFGDCENTTAPEFVCQESGKKKWSDVAYCGMLIEGSGVFSQCHSVVNTKIYFDSCVIDLCATDGNRAVLEDAFEEYVVSCKEQGVDLCDWRTRARMSEISCPEFSTYNGCASPCQDTCLTPQASEACGDQATVEACVCSPGFVREGGRCVRQSECGCVESDFYYRKGQQVSVDAQVCTCVDLNSFKCTCNSGYDRVGNQCLKKVPSEGTTGRYCLEFKSTEITPVFNDPGWFSRFFPGLTKDLETVLRNFDGFLRAEFGTQAKGMADGKVQVILNVTVWVDLTSRQGPVRVEDLIEHYVQSSARKVRFSVAPIECGSVTAPTEDPCMAMACGEHASCQVISGEAACVCEDGYVGDGATCNRTPKGPCQMNIAEMTLMDSKDFVPQCDSIGNYRTWQCNSVTGVCYCVDELTGIMVDWTKVAEEEFSFNCDSLPNTCRYRRARAMAAQRQDEFIPLCDENGNYQRKQCNPMTGMCSCVDQMSGTVVEGTTRSLGEDGPVDCGTDRPVIHSNGTCAFQRAELSAIGNPDTFIPECDSDGDYVGKQCHDFTGQCFCVHKRTGVTLEGTTMDRHVFKLNCDKLPDTCQFVNAMRLVEGNFDGFVPVCDEDGDYDTEQCDDEGMCYCVDKMTGVEIEGTKAVLVEFELDCDNIPKNFGRCRKQHGKKCHEHSTCKVAAGGYNCVCNEGYSGNGFTCEEQNECEKSFGRKCHLNAECKRDSSGDYGCRCKAGYDGDGLSCREVDKCQEQFGRPCDSNADCGQNVDGGVYVCRCKDGYVGNGLECRVMSECHKRLKKPCHENAMCTFVSEQYLCVCAAGYRGDGLFCERISPCEHETGEKCHKDADCVMNGMGAYECRCMEGYWGPGSFCGGGDPPTDPCHRRFGRMCHGNATCETAAGGEYECKCKEGYIGDGYECQEIDRRLCFENLGQACAINARCTTSNGNHTCICRSGYFGNGFYCDTGVSINECHRQFGRRCGSNAQCDMMKDGQYMCNCADDYVGDGYTCQLRPPQPSQPPLTGGEIQSPKPPQTSQSGKPGKNDAITKFPCLMQTGQFCHQYSSCTKFNGRQYECRCWRGFFGDGRHCTYQPIDRCQRRFGRRCHQNAECRKDNSKNYQCQCKDGFFGDGYFCKVDPRDKCERRFGQRCSQHATCQKGTGVRHKCACMDGYIGNGFTCQARSKCHRRYGIECHVHAGCVEQSDNVYTCQCRGDYVGDGFNCRERSGCHKQLGNACHQNAFCLDTGDGYECHCRDGFDGNGFTACNEVYCQRPSDINRGTVSPSLGKYFAGDVISYICQAGDRLIGAPNRTCRANRTFDGVPPRCVRDVQPDQFGKVSQTSQFGRPGQYQDKCHRFYNMPCSPNGRCLVSGGFNQCACRDGYFGDGFQCQSFTERGACSIRFIQHCHPNAECQKDLMDTNQCVCRRGYVGDGFKCDALTCQRPADIVNGRVADTERIYIVNQVVTYQCSAGYQIVGNTRRTCVADETWSGSKPHCEKKHETGQFGSDDDRKESFRQSDKQPGQVGHIPEQPTQPTQRDCQTTFDRRCHDFADCRFDLNGQFECLCREGYSGSGFDCIEVGGPEARCPKPADISFGNVKATNEGYQRNTVLTYECQDGYALMGNSRRTCQSNAQWSGSRPRCEQSRNRRCHAPKNLQNGRFRASDPRYRKNSRVTYRCNVGYILRGDSQTVCQNGAWSGRQPQCVKQ